MSAKWNNDAEAALKKAEKAIRTGMFKWSADWDEAVRHYKVAGTFFLLPNVFVYTLSC
jgi:hypothetical protein